MDRIATLTMNPAVDLSGATERLLVGNKSRCGPQSRAPGGGGINVARGIHELGGEVLAICLAGGAGGDELETLLANRNIPQKRIPVAGPIRENLAIREEISGKLFHFVFPGPGLTEVEWRHCLDAIKHLHPGVSTGQGKYPAGDLSLWCGCHRRRGADTGAELYRSDSIEQMYHRVKATT